MFFLKSVNKLLDALGIKRLILKRYYENPNFPFPATRFEKLILDLYDPAYFEYLRLSGYNDPSKSYRPVFLKGFGTETRFAHKKKFFDKSSSFTRLQKGRGANVIVVVFRQYREEVARITDALNELYDNYTNVRIVGYYSTAGSHKVQGQFKSAIFQVSTPGDFLISIAGDPATHSNDMVLFNAVNEEALPEMLLHTLDKSISPDIDLIMFNGNKGRKFSKRIPERLLNFAVRFGKIKDCIKNIPFLNQPVALLFFVATESKASEARTVKIDLDLVYSSAWPVVNRQAKHNSFFDRMAIRIFTEAMVRYAPNLFSHMLSDVPYSQNSIQLSNLCEGDHLLWHNLLPEKDYFDIVYITTFEIHGGGVASVMEEAAIARSYGFRVAAMHLDAVTNRRNNWVLKQNVLETFARLGIPFINGLDRVTAKLSILRYPPSLIRLPDILTKIETLHAVIVINQPPRRLEDDIPFYNPEICHKNAKKIFGIEPVWSPNGPEARKAMAKYTDNIPLLPYDWINVVSKHAENNIIEDRISRIGNNDRAVVIGRHARDVDNKWPANPDTIKMCYPESSDFDVRFLGGCWFAQDILGYLPNNWRNIEFGAMDVDEFLKEVDIYVFFPHEKRIEPMARCIIEALAAGIPTLLPKRFEGIYGESPIYCNEQDVIKNINELTANKELFAKRCYASRDEARHKFGRKTYLQRLSQFNIK